MTTLPADKLRAMCERIITIRTIQGDKRTRQIDEVVIARALLELLPAEGEGVDTALVEAVVEVVHHAWHALDDGEIMEDDSAAITPENYSALSGALDKFQEAIDEDGHPPLALMSEILSRQPGGDGQGWRDISTVKKDGTPVLLKIVDVIPGAAPDTNSYRLQGIQFVGRNILAKDGYDYGWNFAAPVGYGGIPDEWLDGWQPLPHPPAPPMQAQTTGEMAP